MRPWSCGRGDWVSTEARSWRCWAPLHVLTVTRRRSWRSCAGTGTTMRGKKWTPDDYGRGRHARDAGLRELREHVRHVEGDSQTSAETTDPAGRGRLRGSHARRTIRA